MTKPRSYHFDFGNSTKGPVGFCARVTARSKQEAVKILRAELPPEIEVREGIPGEAIEYIRVYLNPDAVTIKAIDGSDPVKGGISFPGESND